MDITLNSGSTSNTTGLLTGPVTIVVRGDSTFKCSLVKVFIAKTLAGVAADNFAYTGLSFKHQDTKVIDISGEFYLRFDLLLCDSAAEVNIDLISL